MNIYDLFTVGLAVVYVFIGYVWGQRTIKKELEQVKRERDHYEKEGDRMFNVYIRAVSDHKEDVRVKDRLIASLKAELKKQNGGKAENEKRNL